MSDVFQDEFEFTLPIGYKDKDGTVYKDGVMRLATAEDELAPQRDPRVKENPLFAQVITLARTITRLGTLKSVTPEVILHLYRKDLMFLQKLYLQVNQDDTLQVQVECPACGAKFPFNPLAS